MAGGTFGRGCRPGPTPFEVFPPAITTKRPPIFQSTVIMMRSTWGVNHAAARPPHPASGECAIPALSLRPWLSVLPLPEVGRYVGPRAGGDRSMSPLESWRLEQPPARTSLAACSTEPTRKEHGCLSRSPQERGHAGPRIPLSPRRPGCPLGALAGVPCMTVPTDRVGPGRRRARCARPGSGGRHRGDDHNYSVRAGFPSRLLGPGVRLLSGEFVSAGRVTHLPSGDGDFLPEAAGQPSRDPRP